MSTPAEHDAEYEQVAAWLAEAKWVFAKTMPSNPHEYSARDDWADPREWWRVVRFIRTHGYTERWEGVKYTMLDANGFKHWVLFPVINRKPLNRPARPMAYTLVLLVLHVVRPLVHHMTVWTQRGRDGWRRLHAA
jgi:hypothetical protein